MQLASMSQLGLLASFAGFLGELCDLRFCSAVKMKKVKSF
jgi:hypothetical protein